jgi:hypothetical protein
MESVFNFFLVFSCFCKKITKNESIYNDVVENPKISNHSTASKMCSTHSSLSDVLCMKRIETLKKEASRVTLYDVVDGMTPSDQLPTVHKVGMVLGATRPSLTRTRSRLSNADD